MRKNVRYLGNALVLLCSLVISLGGLEIGIRCTHPRLVEIRNYTLFARQFHEADDTLGWKSRGNFLGVFKQAQATSRVTTNSLGMRGSPEISSVQGRKSILILGDSQAWGYGVNDDETFAHFLQEMLGDKAAVFNAGVLGYGTDQELLLLRRVGRLIRPRVVIVAVHLNDLTNIRHTRQYYLEKPIFKIFQNQLVLQNVPANNKPLFTASESKTAGTINSALAGCVSLYWIIDRIDKLKLRLSPAVATTWNYNNWIVLKKSADPQIESSWTLAECLLREMKSCASELGAEVMICPLPFRERIMPQAWQEVTKAVSIDAGAYDLGIFSRRFEEIAGRQGLLFVDPLLPFCERAKSAPLFTEYDHHFTAAGHLLIAQALYEAMRSVIVQK